MIKPWFIFLLFTLDLSNLNGQNLISNGDFETFSSCPALPSQINRAVGWSNANNATSDYFNVCGGILAGVPDNFYGSQAANSGVAYSGFVTQNILNSTFREYIRSNLSAPLIAGVNYTFRIHLSRSDRYNGACNTIGAAFVNSFTNPSNPAVIPLNPQIKFTNYITNQTGWDLLTGNFTASGGEQIIIIGNFEPVATSIMQNSGTGVPGISYYYADDISLVRSCSIPNEILGPNRFLCGDSNTITRLDATNNQTNTYLWNTGAITSSINVNRSGRYWVRMISGSCQLIDTIDVTYRPIARINIPDTTLCIGSSVRFGADVSPASAIWSTTVSGFFINASNPGLYWVQTNLNGCLFRDSGFVKVADKPPVNIGIDKIVCDGDSVVLRSSFPDSTYRWSNGSTDSTIVVKFADKYWLQVSNQGCINRDTMLLSTIAKPIVNLGSDRSFCVNESVRLQSSPFYPDFVYAWKNGSNDSAITVATPDSAFWLRVSSGDCVVADTIALTTKPLPIVNIGPDTTLCDDGNIKLNAGNNGSTFLWNTSNTNQLINVSASGLYWVRVTKDGCSASDSVSIILNPKPNLELGNDTQFCENGSITFDITQPGATYKWHNGSVLFRYTATKAEKVSVELKRGACVLRDSVMVNVLPAPNLNIGADTTLCDDGNIKLDAGNNGGNFLWNTSSTNQSINIAASGLYWVRVTKDGCSTNDSVSVILNPKPKLELGNDTTVCQNVGITFDVIQPGATYKWHNGSALFRYTATKSEKVSVELKRGACVLRDSVMVNVLPTPDLTLGADKSECFQSPVVLTSNITNADKYAWNNGDTTASINIAQPGLYWLQIQQQVCTVRDSILVSQAALPAVNIGSVAMACKNDSVLLDAQNNGAAFEWSNNASSQSIYANAPNWYWVKVTNAQGCFAFDSVWVDTFISPIVSIGADTFLCKGSPITIATDKPFAQYAWSSGQTTSSINTANSGLYIVAVTDANKCKAIDSIFVAQREPPSINLESIIRTCEPKITLKVPQGYVQYLWSTGSTLDSILATEYGEYLVEVMDSFNCTNKAQVDIVSNCSGTVFTPNAFTPNNDGTNDVFKPSYRNVLKAYFAVYDRWGQLLFETIDMTKGWDGTFAENHTQSDVYVYIVKYTGANQQDYVTKGNVTLLR